MGRSRYRSRNYLGRSPLDWLIPPYLAGKRPRRDRDKDDGGVPVEPNKPKNLTGGAAAELEFDE